MHPAVAARRPMHRGRALQFPDCSTSLRADFGLAILEKIAGSATPVLRFAKSLTLVGSAFDMYTRLHPERRHC